MFYWFVGCIMAVLVVGAFLKTENEGLWNHLWSSGIGHGVVYVLTIVGVNIGFAEVPLIDLGFGLFSPMALVVGCIFVVRDYAQRSLGHAVLWYMFVGLVLSYVMADPTIAVASGIAFAVSEGLDWLVYTITRKPFYSRVLISSIVSAPVDTLVFLFLIKLYSPMTAVMMIACKLIAAQIIFHFGTKKARSKQPAAAA